MPITPDDIRRIARLARITLTDTDAAHYERELSQILLLIETLNTVDTANVTPMTGGTTLVNITRHDATPAPASENTMPLISAFTDQKDQYLRVKAIFE